MTSLYNISDATLVRELLPDNLFSKSEPAKPQEPQKPPKKKKQKFKGLFKSSFAADTENSQSDARSISEDDSPTFMQKIKIGGLLFLVFIILSSNVFIEFFLNKWSGSVDPAINSPTTYGTVIQGIMLVLAYVIIDIIVSQGFV